MTSGGSITSTMGSCCSFKDWLGGWGKVNMSLKTGDARERMNLCTRKSRFESSTGPARRTTSPSFVVKRAGGMDGRKRTDKCYVIGSGVTRRSKEVNAKQTLDKHGEKSQTTSETPGYTSDLCDPTTPKRKKRKKEKKSQSATYATAQCETGCADAVSTAPKLRPKNPVQQRTIEVAQVIGERNQVIPNGYRSERTIERLPVATSAVEYPRLW